MSESTFRFRHFTIHQDKCAMKVGTDSVLLGSWVQPGAARRILDIGTGTGILAIMLAQKSGAAIDAIDIDEGAYMQARENAMISPWFSRIRAVQLSFQEFADSAPDRYDLVVSNPPYFHDSYLPPTAARLQARHSDQLPFDDLISGVRKLLDPNGTFCIILPKKEGLEFLDMAQHNGLFCHRMLRVRTRAGKPDKRLLMEFDLHLGSMEHEEMVILEEGDAYSTRYYELTRDYYIGLK